MDVKRLLFMKHTNPDILEGLYSYSLRQENRYFIIFSRTKKDQEFQQVYYETYFKWLQNPHH
jgi:hypothetical protein